MGDIVGFPTADEEKSSISKITPPNKIADETVGFRRNSTGKKLAEKPVPHYLRASTGSCHDLCKYGHRNSAEEPKPWRSSQRRSSASKPIESHVSEETISSLGKKKKSSTNTRRSLDSLSALRNRIPLVNQSRAEASLKSSKEILEMNSSEKKKRIVTSRAASMKVSPKPTLVTGLNKRKQKGLNNEAREREPEAINAKNCENEEKIVYVVDTNSKENDLDSDTMKIVYVAKNEAEDDALYLDKSENFSPTLEDDEKIVYVIETEAKVETFDSDQSGKAIEMKNGYALSEPNDGIEGDEVDQASESENSEKGVLESGEIESETETKNEPETCDSYLEQASLFHEAPEEGEGISESEADTCLKTSKIEEKAPVNVDTLDSGQSDKAIKMKNRYAESEPTDQIAGSEIDQEFEFVSKSENGEKMAFELEETETETEPENHDVTSEEEEEEYSSRESEVDTCSEKAGRRSSIRLVREEKEEAKARKIKFRRGTVLEPSPENNEAPRRLRFRRRNPPETPNDGNAGLEDINSIKRQHEEIQKEEEESDYTTSESEADTCLETRKVEEKARRRSSGLIREEEEEEKARKMKFRRGRVLEIHPEENEAPRRLRYRRRNQDSVSGEITGARVVSLKHREDHRSEESPGKRKEGRRGLFNNVIEETASKLIVESRKSKVKALVGAFETVISLQDRNKPSSSNTNAG